MTQWMKNFMNEEEGQGMAEYALVLGIIAIGVVGLLVAFGEEIVKQFEKVTKAFKNETDSGGEV